MASLWKKNKTRFEISAFQRIRTSITFCYRWLVWQPQHDPCHIIKSWTKWVIYAEKSLTITLRMVIGLFCNYIFGVLVTTLHVMQVLSSALQPARNVFRAEFLGSKPFLLKPRARLSYSNHLKAMLNWIKVNKNQTCKTLYNPVFLGFFSFSIV